MSKSSLKHYLRRFQELAGLALLCVGLPVWAVEPMQSEPVGYWELVKVSGGLLVVVAAIVATAAVIKRLKSMHAAHGSHIKIIDGVSVSTRDRVVLLEVDQQRVLLGVSPGRIQALHVFGPDAAAQPSFVEIVEQAKTPLAGGQAQ